MSDGMSLIVPIGAELGGLAQGIVEAKTALQKFEQQANTIAQASAARAAQVMKAATQPYALAGHGVSPDQTTQPYELAVVASKKLGVEIVENERKTRALAREAARLNGDSDKSVGAFREMGRLTSMIGKGMIAMQAGMAAVDVVSSLVKGDFDAIDKAVENFPLIGSAAKSLQPILEQTFGYTASQFSESLGEARRQMGLLKAEVAEIHAINSKAMALRIDSAKTDDRMVQAENDQKIRGLEIQAKYQQILNDAKRDGFQNGVTEAQILANQQQELELNRIEGEKKRRKVLEETWAEERRNAEEDAGRKGRIMQALINDRERREKEADETRRREFVDRINNETDMLRKQADTLREELSGVTGVRGSDFIQSNSTALGSFTSGQSGASMIVARNVQRQVELQAQIKAIAEKIEANTKAKGGWN